MKLPTLFVTTTCGFVLLTTISAMEYYRVDLDLDSSTVGHGTCSVSDKSMKLPTLFVTTTCGFVLLTTISAMGHYPVDLDATQ